jgi:LysM repeat protein
MDEYVVQPGDTLRLIASRRLGSASRWTEIAALNRLADPQSIYVGQKLLLPRVGDSILAPAVARETGLIALGDGAPQMPAGVALARGFLFVVFEQLPEVGSGRIIRKVAAIPRDFSLRPANPVGALSPAEHVLNTNPGQSPFLSGSNRPFGAPSIAGQPVILDVSRIVRARGRVYSVAEVVADLERFVAENPAYRTSVDRLIGTIRNIEGEVLIRGGTPPGSGSVPSAPHQALIRSAEDLWAAYKANRLTRVQLEEELARLERAYSRARIVGRVGRVLTVVGVIVTVADVAAATERSVNEQSFRPIGAEVVRQVGGWGGAIAGGKIGFATGALFGIETGPGAILTGALGAVVFGAAGYFGADWVADHISAN